MKKVPILKCIGTMEKPSDCCICYETLSEEDKPLSCGHVIHLECVKKHFKPECPLCRAPLNIKVSGIVPLPFIPTTTGDSDTEEEDIVDRYTSTRNIDDPNLATSGDLGGEEIEYYSY